MAIVGSIRDGMLSDPSMQFTKSVLDFISTTIFATAQVGVLFSAVPMAIYQGLITLFAGLLGKPGIDAIISDVSLVGSALIFAVGINMFFGKRVKAGNMLPAIIVPVVYGICVKLIGA